MLYNDSRRSSAINSRRGLRCGHDRPSAGSKGATASISLCRMQPDRQTLNLAAALVPIVRGDLEIRSCGEGGKKMNLPLAANLHTIIFTCLLSSDRTAKLRLIDRRLGADGLMATFMIPKYRRGVLPKVRETVDELDMQPWAQLAFLRAVIATAGELKQGTRVRVEGGKESVTLQIPTITRAKMHVLEALKFPADAYRAL